MSNDLESLELEKAIQLLKDAGWNVVSLKPLPTMPNGVTSLQDRLDPILVKLYHNGYTDHIAGVTIHAEPVKNQWKTEATIQIEADLLAIVGEIPSESEYWRYTNKGLTKINLRRQLRTQIIKYCRGES